MDITIKASDGTKFNGTNYEELVKKVNVYELELKKKKEIAESERKKKEEAREFRYSQVLDKIDLLNKVVESYEKETGEKLEFITVNGKLEAKKAGFIGEYIGIPIYNLKIDTHDNWWNELYKSLKQF